MYYFVIFYMWRRENLGQMTQWDGRELREFN